MRFIVHKENEDLDVLLLRHKNTNKYSYVNLTKGHICECGFDTIGDALHDMNEKMNNGDVINYFKLLG